MLGNKELSGNYGHARTTREIVLVDSHSEIQMYALLASSLGTRLYALRTKLMWRSRELISSIVLQIVRYGL